MNGISPFWSYRTLIAFVVAPPASGIGFLFIMGTMAAARGHGLFSHSSAWSDVVLTIGVTIGMGVLFGGVFGYPFALLVVTPIYCFFLTRMRRVRYRHFLVLWLLMSALWLLLSVDFGGPPPRVLDSDPVSVADDIYQTAVRYCIPTWIAVTVFYLIVRRPVAHEKTVEAPT